MIADPVARASAYLEATAAGNGRLNAFVDVFADSALGEAAASAERMAADRPLSAIDGWCVAVKDNIDIAGQPTGNGLPGGAHAARDAAVVARLRQAGAVILGKTNLHEAALGTTTDNPHSGATQNPLRLGHTPGGSSGGSAAAVAAGWCDAALGTDTMGSVRLPAAYCGIVGFKPSFDAIPCEGVAPLCWALDHVGPMARSVAGAAALFEALADPRAPGQGRGDAPHRPRAARLAPFDDLPLAPDVAAAYARGIGALETLFGPLPSLPAPGFEPVALRRAALLAIEADAAAIHAERFEEASPGLRAMLEYGRDLPAPKLALALERLRQGRRAIAALFRHTDLIVAPTAPQTAFPHGEPAPPSQADFLGLAVFAGAPAISLPLPLAHAEALPAGLQLIAAPGRDRALLQWAASIETALANA